MKSNTDLIRSTYESGTCRATNRSMHAAFAHGWTLHDGKIVRFFQYVDSATVRRAMVP
jgi:ketosteroid isomerase-like protein